VEACGVSAKTGKGFQFMIDNKIPKCRLEYFEVFHFELLERIKQKDKKDEGAISALEAAMK
jgi:hypothetical protein